jgi:hypothetical protein
MSRPSSPRQHTRRGPAANASQAQATRAGTMPAMRFKVQLRHMDSGEVISLVGFIRLLPIDGDVAAQLSDMAAGTCILWNSKKYEVMQ